MVCLLTAPWVQLSVSVGNGWPHNVLSFYSVSLMMTVAWFIMEFCSVTIKLWQKVTLPLMPTKTGSLLRRQSSFSNHETQHIQPLCDSTQMRSLIQISWQSLTVWHNRSSDLLYYIIFKLLTCKISNLWKFFRECALKIALTQNAPNIVWRPGSTRTRWGRLQHSPRPPSWIKRAYF